MTDDQTVLLGKQGSIAVITLNRPDALNALNAPLRTALARGLQTVSADPDARVAVITGRGSFFCAGADIKEGRPSAEETRRQLVEEYGPGLKAIAEMPKPLIAALNGPALGIGLAYALACDLIVMGEGAYLQAPFSNLSLLPDGGLSWLLPRALGYQRAFQFVAETEQLSAPQCLALGLVNRVVPDEEVVSNATAWAQMLALRAPLALAATKQAMRRNASASYLESQQREAELQGPLVQSEDCNEGFRALVEKRAPKFRGR